jgi:iron complex transport system permease protein
MNLSRTGLAWALALVTLFLFGAGLAAGSDGWSWPSHGVDDRAWAAIVGQIRAPRTLGAWAVGALLGLAGAVAQGLFRNPLADPYLLGSAAGASLAVVAVLALGAGAWALPVAMARWAEVGLVVAAFLGALGGLALTLLLARGAASTPRLLLSGVVVGVMLTAVSDLLTLASPDALRGRQGFLLGHTGYLGWDAVAWLLPGLLLTAAVAWRLSRVLDALALGEDGALSLGLDLPRLRAALVAVLALSTGLAVAHAGLVAFVGLVAPHLVRRAVPGRHGTVLLASAAMGGVLLLAADVAARTLLAPRELPVGVLTAVLGGGYLLWRLGRDAQAGGARP